MPMDASQPEHGRSRNDPLQGCKLRILRRGLLGASLFLPFALPLQAQDLAGRIVIYGRVEDADSRDPVEGARVLSPDSSSVVYTDSLGSFAVLLPAGGPFVVEVARLGYLSQRFALDEDAPSRLSVLLLEPAPIAIEGITVEVQSELSELVQNLERRRNAYAHAMSAFDRADLDRLASVGSIADFVHRRVPRLRPCSSDPFHMCGPGRPNFRGPHPRVPVTICLNGRVAFFEELEALPSDLVVLVEIYGGGMRPKRVSVYTRRWMISSARKGRTNVTPYIMGC